MPRMSPTPFLVLAVALAATAAAPRPVAAQSAGCGFVSTSGELPPKSQQLFLATITSVNGKSVSPKFRHRVPAGPAEITVAERIDPDNFNRSQLRDREATQQRLGKKAYKTLQIDVAPDTRYDIAVRAAISTSTDLTKTDYWEPVVWETSSEACK